MKIPDVSKDDFLVNCNFFANLAQCAPPEMSTWFMNVIPFAMRPYKVGNQKFARIEFSLVCFENCASALVLHKESIEKKCQNFGSSIYATHLSVSDTTLREF